MRINNPISVFKHKGVIFFVALVLVLVLGMAGVVWASPDTNVSGTISTDITWGLADSPYIVTGDVTVNTGVTLTIEPGVTVKFQPGKTLLVDGTLNANGTSGNMITFTSTLENPSPPSLPWETGDYWVKIQFNASSNGSISYAIIEYSQSGVYVSSANNISVHDCTIRHGLQCGVLIGDVGNATVKDNTIEDMNDYGIQLSGSCPNTTIRGNTISNIRGHGIRFDAGAGTLIEGNTISNAAQDGFAYGAIQIQDPGVTVRYNNIINNTSGTGIVFNMSGEDPETVKIEYNNISGNAQGLAWPESYTYKLVATKNWWGDALGPKHASNPYKDTTTGDAVSGNVLYYPWYTDTTLTTLSNVIKLTKTGPANAKQGDVITYTIKCKNEGKSDEFNETNVVITETYPPEVEFVEASPTPYAGTNNRWTFATFPYEHEETITVTVRIK